MSIISTMKVFLVEDSAAIRQRVVEMIEADGVHSIVGEADNYVDAVSGIARVQPDVAIFDIKLASGNGIEALVEARRQQPGLRGIVMSNYVSAQHKKASAEAGAAYFLDKSSDFEQIPQILCALAAKKHQE